VDDGTRTLQRLERIERLDREGAPARQLLDELRALVGEAEAWAAGEGDARALRAARQCRSAVEEREVRM
jgi:hypothetical protein